MSDDSTTGKPQGIGARLARKEDARLMRGRGQYVSDMLLPGQQEVAFLRSPIAHGRIVAAAKPAGAEDRVFLREDLTGVAPIVATSTLPSYQLSEHHPLAHGKVRFVGEPVAMCVAPTRALAEDLAEQVELRIDALPALVDA
ncbi:MAG: xanthine dehydrogenase family protein molybdopterin-binding subunit, partial [Ramlibacter sp.]|nr:xanthine dehydrogenase family protein molybdopterin-binding subunit [Ramlibacter sp.]